MNKVLELIEIFSEDPDFIRLRNLEKELDSDPKIKNLLNLKKKYSKEIVLSKHIGLLNNAKYYQNQYDFLNQVLEENEKVHEYMILLDKYHNLYLEIISYLEKNINHKINHSL